VHEGVPGPGETILRNASPSITYNPAVNFLLVYGPPGVGKLTVGKELAALTGFKLFDSHASIDVVRRVFDFGEGPFWSLVRRFRSDIFEAAARHGVDLITTGAYAYPEDTELVEGMFSLVEKHEGQVMLVHLTCRLEVLDERVQSETRSNKMHSIESSREGLKKYDFFTPIPNRQSLHVDNSDLSPQTVAQVIIAHYSLPAI
jgi:shikimate kinase